jgi:hypothetical protein
LRKSPQRLSKFFKKALKDTIITPSPQERRPTLKRLMGNYKKSGNSGEKMPDDADAYPAYRLIVQTG